MARSRVIGDVEFHRRTLLKHAAHRKTNRGTGELMNKVNLSEKLAAVSEHWRPGIVAELNGQEVKVVKVQGEFVWHRHEDADELFLVLDGNLRIDFRDSSVLLGPGELLVVPRGVEHRPVAEREVQLLLFEPAGVRNTGDVEDPRLTAPEGERL